MKKKASFPQHQKTASRQNQAPNLPSFSEHLDTVLSAGKTLKIDGTNVIRVPFGIRQPIKKRPDRPERWATLVLPLQPIGSPNPPPQAA